MIRKYLCLLSILLAPSAHAFELLGLAPGAGRAEVAEALAPLFPAEEALQPAAVGNRFVNVSPYDPACEAPTCMAQHSEQGADAATVLRSAAVSVSFTRKDRLEHIRHETLQRLPVERCAAELAAQVAAIHARAGQPALESSSRRGGLEITRQQWAGSSAGGECLMLEFSCGRQGEASLAQTLSNFALGREDR